MALEGSAGEGSAGWMQPRIANKANKQTGTIEAFISDLNPFGIY